MTRHVFVIIAASLVWPSCDDSLPPVRPAYSEPVLVESWEIPEANALREALVRQYVADREAVGRPQVVYWIQFCDYDVSKHKCEFDDPSRSFFRRFGSEGPQVFPSYASHRPGPPDALTFRMVLGPFWRYRGEQGLVAEVRTCPNGAIPGPGAEYGAEYRRNGWVVRFRSPPPP